MACVYPWPVCTRGLRVPVACVYPWPACTLDLRVPLACVYPWPACTLGLRVPLACVYPWPACTLGLRVPLACVYPWPACTRGLRVPVACVYPACTLGLRAAAFEKALLYVDTRAMPAGWQRDELIGSTDDADDIAEVSHATRTQSGGWRE